MYPRVLQNLLKASTKLKNQRTLKTTTLLFSNAVLLEQKKLPCIIVPHFCTRYFSSDSDSKEEFTVLPKNPEQRKEHIDSEAQKQVDEMLKNNPELEKLKKVIELEISVRRQDGERVPNKLRPRDWLDILKLKSVIQRKKFLNFLFIIEKKEESDKAVKMERNLQLQEIREIRKNKEETDEIVYGIGNNSMLRRIQDTTMSKLWNWYAVQATMFGNKMVFDFSLENFMTSREKKSCAKQILECHAINRQHKYPFHIYLCNVNLKGELINMLNRYLPNLFDDDFPINVTSKGYLDLFEKSNLVYLTSNSPFELKTYNPDMIYIIGALVDRGAKHPVSLAKAKKEGLTMYKLPLDSYLKFGSSAGRDLTLNQVFAIMLDAQDSSWEKAFNHVPKRKLYENRLRSLQRKAQGHIYLSQSAIENSNEKPLNLKNNFTKFRTSISKSILNPEKNDFNNNQNKEEIRNNFQSSAINDFSSSARAKLKKRWSE